MSGSLKVLSLTEATVNNELDWMFKLRLVCLGHCCASFAPTNQSLLVHIDML